MATMTGRPSFKDRELQEELTRLRQVDDWASLGFLLLEYLSLVVVLGAAILFGESRAGWRLSWAWNVPVMLTAIVLIGGLQHRLAGLGHESAHYTLFRNKFLNDLIGDLFCMFPIFATVHFYRLSHMAHHQYTNDVERDPNVVNTGDGKGIDDFPMPHWKFVITQYFRPLVAPGSWFSYLKDYVEMNSLGLSENVYVRRAGGDVTPRRRPRLGFVLGVAYLAALVAVQWALTTSGKPLWLIPAGLIGVGLVAGIAAILPAGAIFQSPFRQAYSGRVAGVLRLAFLTALLVALGLLRSATHGRSTLYFFLLWVVPSLTAFPLFLMLRDIYQHANTDDGRLTNTRVFFCDPLTRWAVLMYGQDMHLPHHLFPAVPHHRLGRLHALLKRSNPEYAAQAVECHGTFFHAREGHPTILDTMAEPRGA